MTMTMEEIMAALNDAGRDYLGNIIDALNDRLARREADLAAAKAEIERLVRALDEEMVSCGIGTFELGNDPKKAVNSLMFWSQGVGEYFAREKAKEYHAANMRLIEERDTLRAQLEQMRTRAEDAERAEHGTPCKCESWQNVCEAAENKCDQLKQQLEQMGRPATDDERDEIYSEGHSPDRYQRLLAARAAKAKEQG